MKISTRIALGVLLTAGAVLLVKALVGDSLVALFMPQGQIAAKQRDVIVTASLIMLAAAVPMLTLLYAFAWRYREGGPHASEDKSKSPGALRELGMWVLPSLIVVGLSAIVWTSTHELEPFKPIAGEKPPITVQVVALRWKWLFIYPEQGIAAVNLVSFPEKTPVRFELTADGPVSSFWIPQLGSQMYAMGAMRTQLNLIADSTGDFPGRNMEINGDGYAGMTFTARSLTQAQFDAWVAETKQGAAPLDRQTYELLAEPSLNVAPVTFSSVEPTLFTWVLEKDKMPAAPTKEDAMRGAEGAATMTTH